MDSGWWIVAWNGERRKTNVEESKRERVGEGKEVLSPSLPNAASSPFFLSHFSFRFPNYLKACYRLTTCIPSFPTFYGIYSTWASSTFGALLLISRNGFGSTNFSTAFRLRNCHFFLSCFHSFIFLCQFLSYFLDVFFASFLSLIHSPPPQLQTRGHDHLVCSRPFVRLFARSWITQKVQAVFWSEICIDWRFSVIETLAVILNCRWQVKRLKVWKENIVFSTPPKKTTKYREAK